ncbi:MAG: hypothetical protein IJQ20_09855 [Paludibacteraceae bacterium]|nr:hypothetical protein [Paludibacteraceae bacterium]
MMRSVIPNPSTMNTAVRFVPTGDVGYCDALVGKGSRAMDDDFKNLSHFQK